MKILAWALTNFGILGIFLAGVYLPNEGLLTLSVGIFWMVSVFSLMLFSKDFAEVVLRDIPDYSGSVPMYIDVTYDVTVAVLLAYHSFGVLSVFYVLHIIAIKVFYENIEKIRVADNTSEAV